MRSIRSAFTALSLVFLSATVLSGCEGCAEAPSGSDKDAGTLPPFGGGGGGGGSGNDGGPSDPNDPPVDTKRTLAFDGASPVELYYGETAVLAFRLRDADGAAVSGDLVRFSMTGTAGQLSVLEATTDAGGVARVTFTAGTADGDVTVTAEADDVEEAATAQVRVRVNPYGTLQVAVASTGRIPVDRAEMLVYRGAANAVPSCAALEAAETPPTATFAADFADVPSQRSFTQQPQGTVVTARAVGFNEAGVLVATGCTEGASIVGGETTSIVVQLQQLPTRLDGDYDVRLQIDVGNAIPEPYETYVDTVSYVLSDPAGYSVYITLREIDDAYLTSFVWWDPDGDGYDELATYEEVAANPNIFNTWRTARDVIDSILRARLGEDYATVTTVGGDLRQALTAFEVGSRFTLTPVEGSEDVFQVSEQWNDLVFTWRHGCPEGDLGCARRLVALEDTTYAPVATEYGAVSTLASTETESERFAIATDPHLFSLRYGAVIVLAMNEVVFPSLSNGQAHDLNEMLNYLINCEEVGAEIEYQTGGLVTADGGEQLCINGLALVANQVEDRALGLEVGGGTPELGAKEQQGALGGGGFYLVDDSHDLVADTVSELSILVQWNDPEDPMGPSTDISAPIVGDGRRAATGCDSDSACEAGTYCAAVPHYLKVRAVEQTCLRPVGDKLGEEACAADSECATGLCVGASQGTMGTCFAACSNDDACGLGTCVADAASVSLDEVLEGLGAATAASCVAN